MGTGRMHADEVATDVGLVRRLDPPSYSYQENLYPAYSSLGKREYPASYSQAARTTTAGKDLYRSEAEYSRGSYPSVVEMFGSYPAAQ